MKRPKRELLITKFERQFKRGFTMMFVTTAELVANESGRRESFQSIIPLVMHKMSIAF